MARRSIICGLAAALIATPAAAELKVGAKAPDFTARAALAGKEFEFTLSRALRRGPVVLYFYPKAFTPGCTVEAHLFAEASGDFSKAGATVVGISGDDIATLKAFSVQECRNKFSVAGVSPQVIKDYKVEFLNPPSNISAQDISKIPDRISYVIAPDGSVAYAYSDRKPQGHVSNTLAVVRKMHSGKAKK